MLIPSKYENLNYNYLILGAHTLRLIKNGTDNIEELFQKVKKLQKSDLDVFFDIITFLWLADLIIYKNFSISLNK